MKGTYFSQHHPSYTNRQDTVINKPKALMWDTGLRVSERMKWIKKGKNNHSQ